MFIFWDFDELAVCISILYIVYNLTDPKNSQDRRNGEKLMDAENSKAMMEAIEAREQQRTKDRFEAHQKDMSKREFEAMQSRNHASLASLMQNKHTSGKLSLDEVLGRKFYNLSYSDNEGTVVNTNN